MPELLASYLLIVSTTVFFKRMNTKRLISVLVCIIIFQLVLIWRKYASQEAYEFIVFHKSRKSVIVETFNNTAHFYHNIESLQKERIFKDYNIGTYSKTIIEDSLKPVFEFKGKTILVIDSLGTYQVNSSKIDIVILRNSPKINLNRLIDSLKPTQIIADGSNYKSYTERWKITCRKRKLPFHDTSKKGAFIIYY